MSVPQPVLTPDEVMAFLAGLELEGAADVKVEQIEAGFVRIRLPVDRRHVRPGGTVSGPTIMAAADVAAFIVTLAHIGRQAMAVTSSLTINFLGRPALVDLIAEATLLKLGRRLSVTDARIYSDGRPDLVAQASVTYALPLAPARKDAVP